MKDLRTRRWYRLHWLTWVTVVVEIAAIAYSQSISQFGDVRSAFFTTVTRSEFG